MEIVFSNDRQGRMMRPCLFCLRHFQKIRHIFYGEKHFVYFTDASAK